jgi:hypothetical protein
LARERATALVRRLLTVAFTLAGGTFAGEQNSQVTSFR